MKRKTKIYRYFDGEEYWETPSLAWIHRIRRELMAEESQKKLQGQAKVDGTAKNSVKKAEHKSSASSK